MSDRPGRLSADLKVNGQESRNEYEHEPGYRSLPEVRFEPLPEFLERVDHSAASQRSEHDMIQRSQTCTYRKYRQTEDNEHEVRAYDYAEFRHEPAEIAVVIQKSSY